MNIAMYRHDASRDLPNVPTSYRLADLSHNQYTNTTSTKKPTDGDREVFGNGIMYCTTLADELRAKRSAARSSKQKANRHALAQKRKRSVSPDPQGKPAVYPDLNITASSSFSVTAKNQNQT